MDFSTFITGTLEEVSVLASDAFGKVTGTTKIDDYNQVLTETDVAIGTRIIERILEHFPTHNIIDEEAGVTDNRSEFTWVVDPIDGTSNFASGLPHYGIMIGLLEKDTPLAGGIMLPFFRELYIAEKSKGAFCNGLQIRVSQETELLRSLVAYGIDGHQENPMMTKEEMRMLGKIVLGIRNIRSSNSAFYYAMVACGKYEAVLNQTSKIWDNVAIHVLIQEAGGVFTDFWGREIDYSHPLTKVNENFTFCAGAPALHKQLQHIIQQST